MVSCMIFPKKGVFMAMSFRAVDLSQNGLNLKLDEFSTRNIEFIKSHETSSESTRSSAIYQPTGYVYDQRSNNDLLLLCFLSPRSHDTTVVHNHYGPTIPDSQTTYSRRDASEDDSKDEASIMAVVAGIALILGAISAIAAYTPNFNIFSHKIVSRLVPSSVRSEEIQTAIEAQKEATSLVFNPNQYLGEEPITIKGTTNSYETTAHDLTIKLANLQVEIVGILETRYLFRTIGMVGILIGGTSLLIGGLIPISLLITTGIIVTTVAVAALLFTLISHWNSEEEVLTKCKQFVTLREIVKKHREEYDRSHQEQPLPEAALPS